MDYDKLYGKPKAVIPPPVEDEPIAIDLPETDDIKELCRAAVPGLVRKAVQMAHESKKLETVLGALKELLDRGYGKPAQTMELNGKVQHETLIIMRSEPALEAIEAEVVKELVDGSSTTT